MHAWTIPLANHRVEVRSTTVADGDFAIPIGSQVRPGAGGSVHQTLDDAEATDSAFWGKRHAIIDLPWTWLRQVHGVDLVMVRAPGDGAGATADGVITTALEAPIAVTTADCSPVVLVSTVGVAVIHAGWRGALAGIVEAAGKQLLAEGGSPITSVLGPCISVDHYAFGADDLARMEDAYGPSVRGLTSDGRAGLDMAAVVAAACERAGWPRTEPTACTSEPSFFSHRVRRDGGRQTTVAWLEPANS